MPPYDRAVTHARSLLVALLLTVGLAACASDPGQPMPDVAVADASGDALEAAVDAVSPADVAPADVAVPDAAVPDVSPPDVAADVTPPDAGPMPDVPQVDAAIPDAAPADVPAPDVAADVAADVARDAQADAGAGCVDRSVRCSGGAPEFCVAGAWVVGSCGSIAPTGATNTCAMNNCYACRRAASGSGCAAEPLCAADVDCFRMGQGRCVGGLCARMGMIACATEGDCGAWQTSTTRVGCVENRNAVTGGVVMACDNTSRPCVDDAMCPRAYRCDLASGYCRTL
jgi:hypothetical protein